jgi:hypothetical protein
MKFELFRNQGVSRMKLASVFCALVIPLFGASAQSRAQTVFETVSLFSDPNGDSCTLIDDKEGPLTIYVVNKIPPGFGLVDSRFRVASSEGFNANYVSEVILMPFHLGDLRAGIEIVYNYCYTGTLLLATMTYMGHGGSSSCAYLEVLPHPESYTGGIDVMDCYFSTLEGSTLGRLLVNTSPGQCSPWCTVGVQSSTWGAVKALYR